MRVLYVAFGTRGDVQPVLLLALRHASTSNSSVSDGEATQGHSRTLAARLAAAATWDTHASASSADVDEHDSGSAQPRPVQPCADVTFVTHAEHAGWTAHVIQRHAAGYDDSSMHFVLETVDTPVCGAPIAASGNSFESEMAAYASSDEFRLLLARSRTHDAVVFNLFACEAAHFAEAFHRPAVAVSPYMMPHTRPTAVEGMQLLQHRVAGDTAADGCTSSPNPLIHACLRSRLAPDDLCHWMYVLYNAPRWAVLRTCLELPPTPALLRPIALLYGFHPSLLNAAITLPPTVACVGFWREECSGGDLPAGNAPLILATLGSLPATFDIIRRDSSAWLHRMESVAQAVGVPMLCCCNGMGVAVDWQDGSDDSTSHVVAVGCSAASPPRTVISVLSPGRRSRAAMEEEADSSAVMSRKKARPAAAAARAPSAAPDEESVLLAQVYGWNASQASSAAAHGTRRWVFKYCSSRLRYARLLQACAAVVHHAGSGITCDALHAGVPQAPLPVMFDQPSWAQAVHSLGVAAPPISYDDFMTDTSDAITSFARGLQSLLQEDTHRLRARAVAASLAREPDAAVNTACLMHTYFRACDAGAGRVSTPTSISATPRPATTTALVSAHAHERNIALMDVRIHACDTTVTVTSAPEAALLIEELWDDCAYFRNGVAHPWAAAYATGHISRRKDVVVINVGAHVGLFELWCIAQLREAVSAASSRPHVHVLSIEPVNLSFDLFDWNMRRCASEARDAPIVVDGVTLRGCTYVFWDVHVTITCVCVALGDSAACANVGGELHMVVYPRMLGSSTGKPLEKLQLQEAHTAAGSFDDAYTDRARLVTLSQLLEVVPLPGPVDMLKVDVEGFELEVLRGINVSDWSRIESLSVESHDVGQRLTEIGALLAEAGGYTVTTRRPGTPAPPSNIMVHAFR